MDNVKANRTKQILLFDDEEAARQFVEVNNRGAAMPEYSITTGYDFNDLDETFRKLQAAGVYMPLPNAELWRRATSYHNKKKDEVAKYFSASGLTEEEQNVVTTDYFNALRGNYNFVAPPAVMYSVLTKAQLYKAFLIDKYGLWQMLLQYADYCNIKATYDAQVRGGNEEAKLRFIQETTERDARLRAAAWALMNRYISLLDFSGVTNETLVQFAATARKFAELYDYCSFYHVCKHAYIAAPDELESIHKPQGLDMDKLRETREQACINAENALNKAAEQYGTIIDAETPEQREQAAKWNRELRLPANYNSICQRPIEVSEAEQVTVTTTIRNYIDGWLKLPTSARFNKPGVVITEYTIQKVIGGLSLLKADRPDVKPKNGLLTYRLNISKFAEYCLGEDYDPNNYEKEALLGGLHILNNCFLIVDRPPRMRKDERGRYKPTGGKSAINLIRLRQYDTDENDVVTKIIIDIVAGNLGGTLKPLGLGDFKKLRQDAKGEFQTRFYNILIGMDNKKEEDIVDNCAGFAVMLKYAEEEQDVEAVRAAKTYIRKKRPAARKKVQQLFEQYRGTGFITSYTRTQNKAGEWVYKWKRRTPETVEEPDLFTDVEVVE